MTTVHGLCARLLRDEALEAGIDPFAAPVAAADRLAMLLERIDELTLRHHDLRGNPARTLGAIVARIDRLKEELVTADEYAAWAATLPERRARRPRARVRRPLRRPRPHAGRARARSTSATSCSPRSGCCATSRTCARGWPQRYRHVLVDELQDSSFARACCCGCWSPSTAAIAAADDDQAIRRFRGAATKNMRDFRARVAGAPRSCAWSARCARAQRVLAAAQAVVEPIEDRLEKTLARATARRPASVAFWRCANERAQAQAVAADVERLIAREGVRARGRRRARALGAQRGPGGGRGARGARGALPPRRARRRSSSAPRCATCWPGCGCSSTPATPARSCARWRGRRSSCARSTSRACIQIARRRKLDMVAALAAATESPQLPPEARERILAFLKLHRAAAGGAGHRRAPTSSCTA